MKTKEQIENAIKKYQQLLEEHQRIYDWEDDFLTANRFVDNKEAYVVSAIKWYEASLAIASCKRLIKNCKWILDNE